MSLRNKRLVFIGGGNMGSALAAGLLASKAIQASRITVTDVRSDLLRSLKTKLGVNVSQDNAESVRHGDVILLCVKPQQMAEVLSALQSAITPRHLVISIAAGIRSGFIEKRLGARIPVIRVMPNTPALYGAGAMVYSLGRSAHKTHETLARRILSAGGPVWKAKSEQWMDAVTALSGSGPAYVFFLSECLERSARKLGLPAAFAEGLARQTIYGAGLMLNRDSEPAAQLRERVTSKGGTTEAALRILMKRLPAIYSDALRAAAKRSRELSK
jgi:pyrroline-5-carboxylate reductase